MSEHIDDNSSGPSDDTDTPGRDASGFIVIDPAARNSGRSGGDDSGTGNDTGSKRGRGRPRGTAQTGASKASDTASLAGLDIKDILLNIHMMLSVWTGLPEMALEEAEAKRLETAIKKVSRHYPVNISQKHVDLSYLVYTIGTIYGTRAVAIYAAKRKSGSTPPVNPDNVVDFNFNMPNVG